MRRALKQRARLALILAAVAGSGCQDIAGFDGSPTMKPGQDCMACHSAGGQASGLQWTVAGTVFPTPSSPANEGLPNSEILIVDSASPPKAITLRSNASGNFYTAESFTGPVKVAIQFAGQRYQMQESPPTGSCNLCHNLDPSGGPVALPAPYVDAGFNYGIPPIGRLFVPASALDGGDG
jgi:hypothetical protein